MSLHSSFFWVSISFFIFFMIFDRPRGWMCYNWSEITYFTACGYKYSKSNWNFVLHRFVEAVERVRVAIDLKISLSCQKIYLWCHYILIFLSFDFKIWIFMIFTCTGWLSGAESLRTFSWTDYGQNHWFSCSRSWKITKHYRVWAALSRWLFGVRSQTRYLGLSTPRAAFI